MLPFLVIGGKDYSFYFIAGISCLLLFLLQYYLAGKGFPFRELPFLWVLLVLATVLVVAAESSAAGFLDLRGLIFFLLLGYAGLCLAAILLARLLYRLLYLRRQGMRKEVQR
jgi:hypothetical protein